MTRFLFRTELRHARRWLASILLLALAGGAADLAILRALGASSRNLVTTLRWQALVLTGAAILIGLPLGLIAGRFAWAAFSSQLGVAPGTVTPVAIPVLVAVGLLALAWLLATVAGIRVPSVARRHRFSGQ